MRNRLFVFVVLLTLLSCNKEAVNSIQESNTAITFNLTVNHPDATTKAVKTNWEDGDVIFVFFSGATPPHYLKMIYDSAVGSWSYKTMRANDPAIISLNEGSNGTMRAIFFPFVRYISLVESGSVYGFSPSQYSYYLTDRIDYSVVNGSVSGTFNMKIPNGFIQFSVDDTFKAADKIELREPHLTPVHITSISRDGEITETALAHGAPIPGYSYKNKATVFSGVLSDDAKGKPVDYHFTLVTNIKDDGDYYSTYYFKSFNEKTFYRSETDGRAVKLPALSNWQVITKGWPIDLGIDVDGKRIYWGSSNLCESGFVDRANDLGDYYAWGETEPYYKSGYAQSSSPEWKDWL